MAISAESKLGISVESTWGAGGSPAIVFPAEDWTLQPVYEQILDNAKRGVVARDFQAYQGIGRCDFSAEGEIFPNLFGYILRCLFGAQATAAGTPNVHTYTFSSTPPSLAVVDDTVVRQHEGQGVMVAEMSLTMNPQDGMLSYTASGQGKQLVGTPSYTFPTDVHYDEPFFLGWQGSVNLAGSWFPIISSEMTISREQTLHYQLQNTQYPGTAYAGAPEVTGSFTIDYTAGSQHDRYLDHEQGSIDIQYDLTNEGVGHYLKFYLGSVDFGEGPVEIDKSAASMTLGYSWRALYVPSQSGPMKCDLACDTATF